MQLEPVAVGGPAGPAFDGDLESGFFAHGIFPFAGEEGGALRPAQPNLVNNKRNGNDFAGFVNKKEGDVRHGFHGLTRIHRGEKGDG